MANISEFDDHIILKEDTHQYFRKHDNKEFTSQSKFMEKFSIPFDKAGMSRRMTDSPEEAAALRAEWEAKGKRATDHGTLIHGEAENILKFGCVKDKQFKKLEQSLFPYISMYKRNFSERIAYHDQYMVAGTADWPALRNTQGDTLILDINDFKTNIENGVRNFTGKLDPLTKRMKYLNKFFLDPIQHLEASDYNKYCLQLSIYGFMFELMWDKVKIGALNIFYIDPDMNVTKMPCTYMRNEVVLMFERYGLLKNVKDNSLISKRNEKTTMAIPAYCGEDLAVLLDNNSDGAYPDPSEFE